MRDVLVPRGLPLTHSDSRTDRWSFISCLDEAPNASRDLFFHWKTTQRSRLIDSLIEFSLTLSLFAVVCVCACVFVWIPGRGPGVFFCCLAADEKFKKNEADIASVIRSWHHVRRTMTFKCLEKTELDNEHTPPWDSWICRTGKMTDWKITDWNLRIDYVTDGDVLHWTCTLIRRRTVFVCLRFNRCGVICACC